MYWVGPAPAPFGQEPPADALVPYPKTIEIESGARTMDVVIQARRGLYISGRVVDASGEPAKFGTVSAASTNPRTRASTGVRAGGRFNVGPLMSAAYQLTATGRETEAGSDPVIAQAGDGDVLLTLRRGCCVEGKTIDAATGEGCTAELLVAPSAPQPNRSMFAASRIDGSFQFTRLEPATYNLTARTNDGRTAQEIGIALGPGDRVSGLVLKLEPGARLRVKYDGEQRKCHYDVRSNGLRVANDRVSKEQPSTQIVPKGKLTIEFTRGGATQAEIREIEVAAGEEKEVVFTDDH
jgi:hypothetical protein